MEVVSDGSPNTRCERCGTEFHCGMTAGEPKCWCADLPRIMPLTTAKTAACLCPDCLKREIEARESFPPILGVHDHHVPVAETELTKAAKIFGTAQGWLQEERNGVAVGGL